MTDITKSGQNNALEDYEEGTYTPTLVSSRKWWQFWKKKYNAPGKYVKVGGVIYIHPPLITRIKDND